MAHTRWATHGAPCDINAHPQSNTDDNEFVVIHNGIMTNFSETKAFLQSKGYSFRSETDTEVICALAKYLYTEAVNQGKTLAFQELVMEVMSLTGGAFAMVFKSYHYPNEIVACKKGSPLIVGFRTSVGQESRAAATHTPIDVSSRGPTDSLEVFLASDSSAIAEYTKNVVYLNDEDVVKVAHGKMEYFNRLTSATNPQPREVQQLEVALESLSRGGYPHFMLKEIFEQTESVFNSMRGRVNFGNGKVSLGGFNNQRKTLYEALDASCSFLAEPR
jgi:glucosamine--fructose-6-phosphate aminotransferase (isomerizing)